MSRYVLRSSTYPASRAFPNPLKSTLSAGTRHALRHIILSGMASAASYRIYEMTIGNQVAGSHTIVCQSDQNAIEKAKEMLADRDLVIRHGARLVARLRVADNK